MSALDAMTLPGRPPGGRPFKRLAMAAAIAAVLAAVPLVVRSSYSLQLINLTLLTMIVVVGLNFITGYTGQINFGQAAFYGIGAYVTGLLSKAGLSFWVCLPASMLACALFSLLLGLPTLRLRTYYLAMATIGFGEIARLVFVHWEPVTGGSSGLRDIPPIAVANVSLGAHWQYYCLFLCLLGVALLVAARIRDSRIGRAMMATRDNELAAQMSGVDTVRTKLFAFLLSAVYAGAAGAAYAAYTGYVSPDQFGNQQAVLFFTMLVVGGNGTLIGPVVGSAFLSVLPELLRFLEEWYLVLYGVGVIACITSLPEGLVGLARRALDTRRAAQVR
jgi:branched-chain amino acid transport system permease protein